MKLTAMKYTALVPLSAVLLLALFGPPAAQAQTSAALTFTLTPMAQTGAPGSTLFFTGMLSNPSLTSTVFLNGDSVTFNAPVPGLTLNDAPFLSNAPAALGPVISGSNTYSGGFFNVALGSSAAPGTYFGTFLVLGGANGSAQDTLASSSFTVIVGAPSPVPEPSSFALFAVAGLGMAGLVFQAHRRPCRPA